MTNPFEDAEGQYVALINADGQYSLWPVTVPVPVGWNPVCGPATRQACLEHIEANWGDLRPRSLVEATERSFSV